MAAPATQGRLCTKLEEMEVGDYIRCTYTADTENVAGVFSDLGGTSELTSELTGISALAHEVTSDNLVPIAPNGYFYFIKVDKSLLIADRIIQGNISYRSLNLSNYIFGKRFNDIAMIRSLSKEEWTKYLTNSDLNGTIDKQDINVWHGQNVRCTNNGNYRHKDIAFFEILQNVKEEKVAIALRFDWENSMYDLVPEYENGYKNEILPSNMAFRPALEYIDNKKSKTIWY